MSNVNNGNIKRWEKLEELLEVQNEILTKHFGYSNEMDVLEDIRNELSEEIQRNKETEPVDSITAEVMGKLAARSHTGIKTYSVTMDRNDLTPFEWMAHLHAELLDAAVYLQKLMRMQQNIEQLQAEASDHQREAQEFKNQE